MPQTKSSSPCKKKHDITVHAISDFNFHCQYLCYHKNYFTIAFSKLCLIFVFHEDICYFCHGQGRDNMMQDSPAAHNHHYWYTLVFYIYTYKKCIFSAKLLYTSAYKGNQNCSMLLCLSKNLWVVLVKYLLAVYVHS